MEPANTERRGLRGASLELEWPRARGRSLRASGSGRKRRRSCGCSVGAGPGPTVHTMGPGRHGPRPPWPPGPLAPWPPGPLAPWPPEGEAAWPPATRPGPAGPAPGLGLGWTRGQDGRPATIRTTPGRGPSRWVTRTKPVNMRPSCWPARRQARAHVRVHWHAHWQWGLSRLGIFGLLVLAGSNAV